MVLYKKRIVLLFICAFILWWFSPCIMTRKHHDDSIHLRALKKEFLRVDTTYVNNAGFTVIEGLFPDSTYRRIYFK